MSALKLNNQKEFRNFNGSERAFKNFFGIIYTEGIKYLADTYECYWLIDLIAIRSKNIKGEDFQVWNLKRVNNTSMFRFNVSDGNKNPLETIGVPFSDFKENELDVWLVNNMLMLPSEY